MAGKHLRGVVVVLLAGLSLPAQAVVASDGQGAFFSFRSPQADAKPQAPAQAPRAMYPGLGKKPDVTTDAAPKRRAFYHGLVNKPTAQAALAGASAVEMVRQFNTRANAGSTHISQQELNQLITWMTRGTGRNYGGARFADTLRKAGPAFKGLSASERTQLAAIANRAKSVVEMKKRAIPAGSQESLLAPLMVDSRFADMLLRLAGSKPAGSGDMRVSKP